MDFATVSSNGQMVIPASVRKELGLAEGVRLLVYADPGKGEFVAKKLKPDKQKLDEISREVEGYLASIGKAYTEDEIVKAVKEIRKRHENRH